MTTALYRRYRPESFGEMIGQSQVTEPLMTALRGDRVGHAYLFSGPRGCGKTTSARILARCLNCAQGPTDTPCGTCDSCVELSRGGGGSLDVVEIDAASHNGVDDARELRERAVFAPSRDRYKIFILDEAHMVTAQGFNALLKLVEEPPPHVKFIFATTEPEKVLGTIRSRTHHYPFRLVPPAAMLEYVEQLCKEEGVATQAGVLPLVVRAGGGSPRDTLSLLDQLIAGSEVSGVTYERAVSLLGYTHTALLDEIVGAFGSGDAPAAFAAIDRVVQTGQDPRRFVDDLLERLRDLIIIAAVGPKADDVLRSIPVDERERMHEQALQFGRERLSRTADVVSSAFDEMSGATSPRLHLELLVARILAAAAVGSSSSSASGSSVPEPERAEVSMTRAGVEQSALPAPAEEPAASPEISGRPVAAALIERAEVSMTGSVAPADLTFADIEREWQAILEDVAAVDRTAWLVLMNAAPVSFEAPDVLGIGFRSAADLDAFKGRPGTDSPAERTRHAINARLGVRVKYRPTALPADAAPPASPPPADAEEPAPAAEASVTEWAVAAIPQSDAPPPAHHEQWPDELPPDDYAEPEPALPVTQRAEAPGPNEPTRQAPTPVVPPTSRAHTASGAERYGEAVVREVLGAELIGEEPYDAPTRFG